ncbi:MAG: GDSL-type esterase/lipase family protein [Paludibacter sp.]
MFWYEDEVKELERKAFPKKTKKKRVVFYGSSSLRLWDTIQNDFPEFQVINQSFGGSTLASCCWFFERLIPKTKPDILILYAGDNDLGDNRHPEEVYFYFVSMIELIKENFDELPVAFISVKNSPSRKYLEGSINYTNKIIAELIEQKYPQCTFIDINQSMLLNNQPNPELFEPDGLHLSKAGYAVWKKEIKNNYLSRFLIANTK